MKKLFQSGFQLGDILHADEARHFLAFLEDNQRGDGVNAQVRRQLLRVIDVELADFCAEGSVFFSSLMKHLALHLAGTAPCRPEIHKHLAVRGDELLKTLFCQIYHFVPPGLLIVRWLKRL